MVLVSHSKEFIFLKTRKTAGTSIEMMLEHACMPPGHVSVEQTPTRFSRYGIVGARLLPERRPRWLWRRHNAWRNHMTANAVHKRLGARRFNRYTKIAGLRNPFDRTVSQFHWQHSQSGGSFDSDREMIEAFRAFVGQCKLEPDHDIVHLNGQFVPDLVIRYEELRNDVDAVAQQLGMGMNLAEMPHAKNLTKARRGLPTSAFFDAPSTDIVLQELAWFFEQGGYPETPELCAPNAPSSNDADGTVPTPAR